MFGPNTAIVMAAKMALITPTPVLFFTWPTSAPTVVMKCQWQFWEVILKREIRFCIGGMATWVSLMNNVPEQCWITHLSFYIVAEKILYIQQEWQSNIYKNVQSNCGRFGDSRWPHWHLPVHTLVRFQKYFQILFM